MIACPHKAINSNISRFNANPANMKPLFILLLSSIAFWATAQDNIIFMDGTEIQAKVLEITPTEVAYKQHDNLQGPDYRVLKSTVFLIQFANGTSQVITPINLNQMPSGSNYQGRRLVGTDYRSPGLAFLFSFLMPGGGQYYNHQYGKGATMTALWMGGIITASTSRGVYKHYDATNCYTDQYGNYNCDYYPTRVDVQRTVGMVTLYGSWIWSMIDAPVSAARINRRNASGVASLLHFNMGNQASLRFRPFQSQGLGGSVAVSF